MSQTDLNVANASGATVRADLNNHLSALATNAAGATAPSVTFPNMWWFDTSNALLKQRDNANTAWVTVAAKDASGWRPYYNGSQLDSVFLTAINDLTAETAPAVGDLIGLYDLSATAYRKMTLANMLAVINGLTADASPDAAADYVVTYDASAAGAKKVLLSALGGGFTDIASQTATGAETALDFTSIPSSAKVVLVKIAGLSASGTDKLLVQIGDSGGIEATGYVSSASIGSNGNSSSAGFLLTQASTAANAWYGELLLSKVGSVWVAHGGFATASTFSSCAGGKALSGTLDRVRVTVDGANTLDGGTAQAAYL